MLVRMNGIKVGTTLPIGECVQDPAMAVKLHVDCFRQQYELALGIIYCICHKYNNVTFPSTSA